jgi:acetyl-CoA C-acetyltransferase
MVRHLNLEPVMSSDPVVIVSAVRTPMGAFQGAFKDVPVPELGATAIRGALAKAGLAGDSVSEVLMGCVLTAGVGQAPARQAALKAGLSLGTPCTTIGKVCGSGLKAVMIAHDAIVAGSADIVVAGGMESMTGAPFLLSKGRGGYRMGHSPIFDSMMLDGLEDAYEAGRSMGTFGEDCAAKYKFSRQDQDAFATASVQRAQAAIANGAFADEIVPVTVRDRSGETVVSIDEGPGKIKLDKIPTLKPAFKKDGTITAASSSSINDGAAALVLMRASKAAELGLKPIARVLGHSMHAQEPGWFTTAPVGAMQKLFSRIGWTAADVDLYEINEAFAVVPMAAMAELGIPHEKVNVNGGACALGHPIGASGARVLVTLLHALRNRKLKRGLATLCIGGGEATALAVELI